LKTFIIALVVIMVIATPVFAYVGRTIDAPLTKSDDMPVLKMDMNYIIPEDSPFFEAFTQAEKVNILLIGVNTGLTDTIMLVSLDTKNKHIDIISVPRDTYYQRPGYNGIYERKINAAYRGSPLNTAYAVSDVLLGIPINYYILVDYEGIKKIVDSMGGVPMDIPFAMKYNDPKDTPPLHIDIPKGQQILNGEQAVQFLRYRKGYPDADLGRIKAQQQFMVNAFKQCLSFDLPKIAATVYDNITTDLNLKTIIYLTGEGVGITADDIKTYTMPGNADPNAPYYVYPKSKEIADMLTEIYSIDKTDETVTDETDATNTTDTNETAGGASEPM